MRRWSLSVTMLALFSAVACHKPQAVQDDLTADLSRASSASTLALAPTMTPAVMVVSPEEQTQPRTRLVVARHSSPVRTPHIALGTPAIRGVSAPVAIQPVPEVMAPVALAPVVAAPQAPVVPVSYPDPASAGHVDEGARGGSGMGSPMPVDDRRILGGCEDGHCSPHGGRGGRPPIAINRSVAVLFH